MMTPEFVMHAIQQLAQRHAEALTELNKRIAAIQKVEAGGLNVVKNRWDIGYTHAIKREDLPLLRKIVGRVAVSNTTVPYDYDTRHEIEVTLRPVADEFKMLSFSYQKPYSGKGKCKVVESTQTYRSLVCTK